MKQQTIKQLALLGLASGLLAATATAQAAEKSTNDGANRSPNRSQPIAGCRSGGCASIADNSCAGTNRPSYGASSSCGNTSQPTHTCSAAPQKGQSSSGDQNSGDRHDLIQAGCAPHTYSVNSPSEQYDPARHGKPELDKQAQAQPQSSFRYIGDTTVPPKDLQPSSNGLYKTSPNFQPAQQSSQQPSPYSNPTSSRQNNSSRFLSDTAVPSSTSTPPSTPVYNTPPLSHPQGNPAPFKQTPTSTPSTHMSPSPYSPQTPHNTMNDQQRFNHNRMEDHAAPAPTTEPTKKTFW